jgi:methionine sulfoxide reductase heme-binding subunit
MRPSFPSIRTVKAAVWFLGLAPLARLVWKGFHDGLGANPIEFVTLSTGTWALVLLLCSLSVTPLRRLSGISWLIRFRRLLGLFAFFYAALHFTTYLWLDKFFDLPEIWRDVAKRPFITAGFFAFALLIPLAATSTAGSIRRLGGRRWQILHRAVYISACSAVLHFWWKVKADTRQPSSYAAILLILLAYRLLYWSRQKQTRTAAVPAKTAELR